MSPISEQMKPLEEVKPQEVSAQEVLKNLGELLSTEETRKKVLNSILGKDKKRPNKWSSGSNPPYYKARFAKELQFHLDEMIKDGEDRLYLYKDFNWLNRNSLYLMLNQSFRYLIDHLDPDGKYGAFRELLTITREKDSNNNPKGVRMSITKDLRLNVPSFKARKISDTTAWRYEMEEFIEEGAENTKFMRTGVALSEEEQKELSIFLAQFPNIIAEIGSFQIQLVKTSIV